MGHFERLSGETNVDEIRRLRLEICSNREIGVIPQARLARKNAQLSRELAAYVREDARILHFRTAENLCAAEEILRQRAKQEIAIESRPLL